MAEASGDLTTSQLAVLLDELENRNCDATRQAVRDWAADHPADSDAQVAAFRVNGEVGGAIDLESTRVLTGLSPLGLAMRGSILAQFAEIEAATEDFEKALAMAPNNPFVLREALGFFALTEDEYRTEPIFSRLMLLAHKDPALYKSLIFYLLMYQRIGEAEQLRSELLKFHPDHEIYHYVSCRLATAQRRLDESLSHARSALHQNAENANCWALLAAAQFQLDDLASAQSNAEFALEINSKDHSALGVMAQIKRRQGDLTQALAFEQQQNDAWPIMACMQLLQPSRAYLRMGHFKLAIQSLEAHMDHQLQFIRRIALEGTVHAALACKDVRLVEAVLQKMRKRDHPLAIRKLEAKLELLANRPGRAVTILDDCIRENPRDIQARVMQMEARIQSAPDTMLSELAEDAQAEAFGAPYMLLGFAHEFTKRQAFDQARQILDFADRRFPFSSKHFAVGRAEVLAGTGDRKGARALLKSVGLEPPGCLSTFLQAIGLTVLVAFLIPIRLLVRLAKRIFGAK